jgi:hypothetical protein
VGVGVNTEENLLFSLGYVLNSLLDTRAPKLPEAKDAFCPLLHPIPLNGFADGFAYKLNRLERPPRSPQISIDEVLQCEIIPFRIKLAFWEYIEWSISALDNDLRRDRCRKCQTTRDTSDETKDKNSCATCGAPVCVVCGRYCEAQHCIIQQAEGDQLVRACLTGLIQKNVPKNTDWIHSVPTSWSELDPEDRARLPFIFPSTLPAPYFRVDQKYPFSKPKN